MVEPRDDAPWSAEERQALDAWAAPEPPAGFAARVAAADARRRSRRRWVGIAAAAALAAGVLAFAWPGGEGVSGSVAARERTTTPLADRGVAVSEAGAELSWEVAADGAAHVRQERGDTFYRVDPGGPFRVETPAGAVRADGTCFRVSVRPPMNKTSAALMGSVAGAAITAVVLVTVYEGRVEATAADGRPIHVEAGEQVALGGPPSATAAAGGPDASPSTTERPAPSVEATGAKPPDVAPPSASPTGPQSWQARAEGLSEQVARLEGQVERLRRSLEVYEQSEQDSKTYDLSPDKLRQLAERCELRWDHPPIDEQKPPTVAPELATEIGLSAAEVAAVNEEMATINQQLVAVIRAGWLDLGGEPEIADRMASEALMRELEGRADQADAQRAFERLSAERAGLLPPPPPDAPRPVIERVLRAVTASGDALERAIAERIGPELAEDLRDARKGWGSRLRASPGCPDAPEP